MQASTQRLLVISLLIFNCNAIEDLPSDYLSFFDLETPTVDYMDYLMSSSYHNPATISSHNPTPVSFDNFPKPEYPSNVPLAPSEARRVSASIPRNSRQAPDQGTGSRPNNERNEPRPLVSSNEFAIPTSLPEIQQSLVPSAETPPERNPKQPGSSTRASRKWKSLAALITQTSESSPPSQRPSNQFDPLPTTSQSSPLEQDVSLRNSEGDMKPENEMPKTFSGTKNHTHSQERGKRARNDLKDQRAFGSSNRFDTAASSSTIHQSHLPSGRDVQEFSPSTLEIRKRKISTLTTRTPEYFPRSKRPHNGFDSLPTASKPSSSKKAVSSTKSSEMKQAKEKPNWLVEIQNYIDTPNVPIIYWSTTWHAKEYKIEFPSSIVNIKNRMPGQYAGVLNGLKSTKLVFDEAVLTNHASFEYNLQPRVVRLIEKISHEGPANGILMMTKDQFMNHHIEVNSFSNQNKTPTQHTTARSTTRNRKTVPKSPSSNEGRARVVSAQRILIQNKDAWLQHWNKHSKFNLIDLIGQVDLIQPVNMRNTIITFLFYVEMIETVLPRSWMGTVDVGIELEEAFRVLGELLNPESTNYKSNENRQYIFDKIVILHSLQDNIPALWILIGLWIKTYRKDFANVLIPEKDILLRTSKAFFNTLFYYSIDVLSSRIKE
ncbi:hypothetical protein PGT21_007358 [Puccinia graminis f. sp. tritici]|uniref:Uncharacterized protein n=1 Tax=Puccinia graminis f. sp. tritici TaxID=56615 RepID=A0A5B0M1U8_PUCGR|nr:hypothetical protein PGT21_007358 [Puccinia graminis f. sp. tritici]KAA1090107.1 hypothetical protein PGTUg99_035698 [Puccinia graminis f. sp. tritici]